MTFHDISMKMLIANFRRYRLYFLCNMFSVALFYSFAAIFANKTFMNGRIVDSMISSNIIAPSVFSGIFILLFIPYANNAFLKNRKYEYGILMTLGMSETEVLSNMLLETCIIAAASLIAGLLMGTLLSFVFYFVIHQIIGITALQWYFNPDSYKWTAVLYAAAMLVTLAAGVLGFMKAQLSDLLKEKFSPDKKGKGASGIFAAGVVLFTASILSMALGYGNGKPGIWLISMGLMFAGLYMITTRAESVEQLFIKVFPDCSRRNILALSFIRRHFKSRGRISLMAVWLIGFSVFLTGICAATTPNILKNAVTYSPYDLAYSKIFEKNQVEDREIENLLAENGVSVKSVKQAEYLRGMAFNLLPVSEVNKDFGCCYQIPRGFFLNVFQFDLKDGYEHDLSFPENVSFDCKDEKVQLKSAGSDVRILFNRNPAFADSTLVLNDVDYAKIASECKRYWKSTMKLYTFDGWKDSGKGVTVVQEYLFKENRIDPSQQIYYKATSRIEAYTTAEQSSEFLIFLMLFTVVLFCAASDIMVHFTVMSESEEERRMLSGLYRIGITAKEMLGIIVQKNKYYYMPQIIAGLCIGIFYSYVITEAVGYRTYAIVGSLLVGAVLAVIQFVVVKRYSGRELSGLGFENAL